MKIANFDINKVKLDKVITNKLYCTTTLYFTAPREMLTRQPRNAIYTVMNVTFPTHYPEAAKAKVEIGSAIRKMNGNEVYRCWTDIDLPPVYIQKLISLMPKHDECVVPANIQKIAFERFKLWWMIKHGASLGDFADQLEVQLELDNEIEPVTDPLDVSFRGLMEKWEDERGFNGCCIWPCFKEFCNHEYRDEKLMSMLLTDAEYEIYEEDISPSIAYEVHVLAANDEILSVNTFGTLSKAKQMYDRLKGPKALLKVDQDGDPIEELEYEKG